MKSERPRRTRNLIVCAAMLAGCLAGLPVCARELPLTPPGAELHIRAYGLGLLPLDGRFTRFSGLLTYDPENRGSCHVALAAEVASLTMANTALQNEIVGPDFMDAQHYPMLRFVGACRSPGIAGLLAMHGVTRPFALDVEWSKERVEATGRLQRADWGMTARPLLGGSTIRIKFSVVTDTGTTMSGAR
jgi:polyisoprenoid-binding protein YceI